MTVPADASTRREHVRLGIAAKPCGIKIGVNAFPRGPVVCQSDIPQGGLRRSPAVEPAGSKVVPGTTKPASQAGFGSFSGEGGI